MFNSNLIHYSAQIQFIKIWFDFVKKSSDFDLFRTLLHTINKIFKVNLIKIKFLLKKEHQNGNLLLNAIIRYTSNSLEHKNPKAISPHSLPLRDVEISNFVKDNINICVSYLKKKGKKFRVWHNNTGIICRISFFYYWKFSRICNIIFNKSHIFRFSYFYKANVYCAQFVIYISSPSIS